MKYYWIKLKSDFFEQDTIDFLMSQKNGCQYIVLYQMLCLKTINTEGEFVSKIGEMIVPYDIEKIVRDTKYFDFDTVTIALELFSKLGLIYKSEDDVLKIADFSTMVGKESESAERVRNYRKNKQLQNTAETQKALQCNENVTENVTLQPLQCNENVTRNVTVDIRDKRLEIRD